MGRDLLRHDDVQQAHEAGGTLARQRRADFVDRARKVAVGLGQMAQRALQQVLIFFRSSHMRPHSIFAA
ncbi:MAG: hypothetical protein C0484_10340 [Rhodospirillum sp.]|nr:hypothetical protein [Rhodospirillum sp.]